jgi:hypothetical protein
MKVLLVEDEKKIASLIRKDLEARGFVVDVSNHGDEGYLATTRPTTSVPERSDPEDRFGRNREFVLLERLGAVARPGLHSGADSGTGLEQRLRPRLKPGRCYVNARKRSTVNLRACRNDYGVGYRTGDRRGDESLIPSFRIRIALLSAAIAVLVGFGLWCGSG